MRTLSSSVLLVLMLGSCGLKAPIYIPKDPKLCLGCLPVKKEPKVEGQEELIDKEKFKGQVQEEPIDKRFKYIPKVKGQEN